MKQNLALFDLDNTLLAGDSDYNWSLFLIKQGLLDEKTHHERNEQFYLDYKNGTLDIYKFLAFQLKPLAEHSVADLNALHANYMESVIRPMMTKKAQDLVNQHKAQGDLCLVITATNSFVTKSHAVFSGVGLLGGVQRLPIFIEHCATFGGQQQHLYQPDSGLCVGHAVCQRARNWHGSHGFGGDIGRRIFSAIQPK